MLQHTELARLALRRIAALQLPPTPRNFKRFYQEALGVSGAEGHDDSLVASVEQVVGKVSATTENLAAELVEHNEGLKAAIKSHGSGAIDDPSATSESLIAVVAEILLVVRASQNELAETRQSLSLIKAQLAEDRKLLEQDPLTGSDNRRSLTGIISREIAHAQLENEPLSVAMIDLDHFKSINDMHGHAAGDAALVHLTSLAGSALRGHDAFARYGGEEFVLVLPATAVSGAVFAVKRLQTLLARKPLVYEEQCIPMTFSAGVATLHPGEDQTGLLRRADSALYEAKRAGRNCVFEASATLSG
jgi:diguanylate cyclase